MKSYDAVTRYRIYNGTEYSTAAEAQKQAELLAERMFRGFLNADDYLRNNPLLHRQFTALFSGLIDRADEMQQILDCIKYGKGDEENED